MRVFVMYFLADDENLTPGLVADVYLFCVSGIGQLY